MAACRFLLYVLVAASAPAGISSELVWRAAALAAYIVGLSFIARRESAPSYVGRWPIALLFVPIVLAFVFGKTNSVMLWIPAATQLTWLVWCLQRKGAAAHPRFAAAVSGLLAGIVLVDWLAAATRSAALSPAFLGLFLLALILQRVAPAT
jgi:4-hydroxybenzoate polyprenyltransferase